MNIYSIVTGTGSCIPNKQAPNSSFSENVFYDINGKKIEKPNKEIIKKLEKITGIIERRYIEDNQSTSDIAFLAGDDALVSSGTDKESLDYIIVAHNFGDIRIDNKRSDLVPSLASKVKYMLGIKNPNTKAHDTIFGCPGWLQGMIQADYYIKSGDAKRILVIGAEALSRVSDPHDINSMIYADGAGAAIVEVIESDKPVGILAHASRSDTFEHAYRLKLGRSYNPDYKGNELFLKMEGTKIHEYSLKTVPLVIKDCLDKAGLSIQDINKILLHQANAKMDESILKNVFKLYGLKEIPDDIMPMTISWLGNSSVATLPTLLDLLLKGKLNNHLLNKGDVILFASVGAGMNINSVVYRIF